MTMNALAATAGARSLLATAGYGDDVLDYDYPVWLGREAGIAKADLVAFGRPNPKDMSTAVVTLTSGTIDTAFEVARVVAAPYFFIAADDQLDLWVAESAGPRRWRAAVTTADIVELSEWLRPSAALTTKVGLRQLPLFEIPVNLLATARSRCADQLAPIVGEALEVASKSLPASRNADPEKARRLLHRRAARLVVGSLTVLVMRDRDRQDFSETDALIERVVRQYPSTFSWFDNSSPQERTVLATLVKQLGDGIDYRSLDPSILSHVYEQALVDDDDRKRLGIHYTPPRLASRLLTELPVELVAPDDRHVLDPSCGSGTLLVAAHDRLRDLQPSNWTDEHRHRDLAVHLHGYDIDPFAAEIARLTLLLHAQPAGNGWQIDEVDTTRQAPPALSPSLIVTNPPWRFSSDGHRAQVANEFLDWSIRALAPGGLLGVLLPGSWLSADNSEHSRAALTEAFDVFEIWRLPEGTFATSQVSTAVLLARKRDGLGGIGSRVIREVDRRRLGAFLAGSPAPVNYVQTNKDAPLHEAAPPLLVHAPVVPLGQIADILSGTQPLAKIIDRGKGTLYLNHFGDVSSYSVVREDLLWRVSFPNDFQGARGARNVEKKKVLASAARNANSPWRFHVAIDLLGIAVRNSVRGIAPHDQTDEDLLHALMIIVGSGFASAFAASYGNDRNISARVLPSLPIPARSATLKSLATIGRRAAEMSHDPQALHEILTFAEQAVWDAYEIDEGDRAVAIRRFAGHSAPEGGVRYPEIATPQFESRSTFRRIGTVLNVEGNAARIWVNGITPDEGVLVPFPVRMPGWLARGGATFDVTGVETVDDVATALYRFQSMSWQDIDFDSVDPTPILPR